MEDHCFSETADFAFRLLRNTVPEPDFGFGASFASYLIFFWKTGSGGT